MTQPAHAHIRLAELLGVLSLGADLGMGREVEVLQLLACGLSSKEIAERLVISRKTVGHHVEHIYAKTDTANRALAAGSSPIHSHSGTVPPSWGSCPIFPGNKAMGLVYRPVARAGWQRGTPGPR